MAIALKYNRYLMPIFISVPGAILLTYFTCHSCRDNAGQYGAVALFSSCLWISLWLGNEFLTDFLSKRISWVEFPLWRMTLGVVSTVVFTIVMVMLLVLAWEWMMDFSFGPYSGVVAPALVITFLISLFLHGRQFLINWRKSAIAAGKLEKENAEARYESLKSQVNPHFLFNSLNALTNLVYEDQDKAAKFIKQLSDVYRYVLDSRDKELVSLEDELKFIESYLFLQRIRFGDKLDVRVELHGISSAVAPLALQMLIENAIKHNEISSDNPLHISVHYQKPFLVVENSVMKKKMPGEDSSGLGLENIRRRYEFLTTVPVDIINGNGKFIVRLPTLNFPG